MVEAENIFFEAGVIAREEQKAQFLLKPGDLVKYMGWVGIVIESPMKEHFIGIIVNIWVNGRIMKVPIGLLE